MRAAVSSDRRGGGDHSETERFGKLDRLGNVRPDSRAVVGDLLVRGDVEKDAELFESIEAGAGDKLKRYVSRSSVAYKLAVQYFLYNNFLNL